MTAPPPPVVSMRDVGFAYGAFRVLMGVTFDVQPGELNCIVGPNGGGKSTLLRLMLGLLRPSRGEVRIFGQPPERARRRIGFMPQHVRYDERFPITVLEVVLMGRLGRRLGGRYSREDREVARRSLEEVELPDLAERSFARLSGGQRQRVLIARALACEPDLLLLDEPTSNVDAMAEARLFELLAHLNERMTILMVSHDLAFVSRAVGNVICVNRRVVVHPTREITGRVIRDLYGTDMTLIDHQHHVHGAHCAHD